MLLAAVLAAVVSQAGLGSAPAFRVPDYRLATPLELPLFLLFGALCGGVSALFTYATKARPCHYQTKGPACKRLQVDCALRTAVHPTL